MGGQVFEWVLGGIFIVLAIIAVVHLACGIVADARTSECSECQRLRDRVANLSLDVSGRTSEVRTLKAFAEADSKAAKVNLEKLDDAERELIQLRKDCALLAGELYWVRKVALNPLWEKVAAKYRKKDDEAAIISSAVCETPSKSVLCGPMHVESAVYEMPSLAKSDIYPWKCKC